MQFIVELESSEVGYPRIIITSGTWYLFKILKICGHDYVMVLDWLKFIS